MRSRRSEPRPPPPPTFPTARPAAVKGESPLSRRKVQCGRHKRRGRIAVKKRTADTIDLFSSGNSDSGWLRNVDTQHWATTATNSLRQLPLFLPRAAVLPPPFFVFRFGRNCYIWWQGERAGNNIHSRRLELEPVRKHTKVRPATGHRTLRR